MNQRTRIQVVSLPLDIEGLTPEWFTNALLTSYPGLKVTNVSIDSVIWGTATKVFVSLTYAKDPGPGGPPVRLVVKAGFNPEHREMISDCYLTEARFYADIAPNLNVAPHCYFAASDSAKKQGIILMEDVVASGATFPSPLEAWAPELIAATLDQLASFHGLTWDRRGLDRYGWLGIGASAARRFREAYLGVDFFNYSMSQPQAAGMPEVLRDRTRLQRAIRRICEINDNSVLALSHGDAHVGNTYITADGAPRVLDWMTTCMAPWSDDFTYFLGGALNVADRRVQERDLLKYYLDALHRHGGPKMAFDDAWLEYRRHHVNGITWFGVPEAMQPLDVTAAMVERYSAAMVDHDTFGALGV